MKISDTSEIYIHIPFCVRKCLYCDFTSFPADDDIREKYVDALTQELYFIANEKCHTAISAVFIGGGTPSVLPGDKIQKIMECVRSNFDLCDDAEITIECNPGTLSEDKVRAYKQSGINRISLGLQSSNDEELKKLGRIHTYDDFLKSRELVKNAGFTNINVDLMNDIPGQRIKSWEQTLRNVSDLEPSHISAYSLIVEDDTPFGEMKKNGELEIPDEDTDRMMYHMTSGILSEYGYERYEISNYAKKGYECRHNTGYWTGVPYYGAGIDASSYYDNCRFVNSDDILGYIKDPLNGHFLIEKLKKNDLMSEYMILGLRMIKGVSYSCFEERFSESLDKIYEERIAKNIADGLLKRDDDRLFLTERGLDLANVVMQGFI